MLDPVLDWRKAETVTIAATDAGYAWRIGRFVSNGKRSDKGGVKKMDPTFRTESEVEMAFTISDYPELLTLHRGLLEAKFSEAPNDPALVGSSILGSLLIRAIEEMKILLLEKGDKNASHGWDRWRRRVFTNETREWKICLGKARNIDKWKEWDIEKKGECVEILFSPFILEPEVVGRFIRQVDEHIGK